MLREARVKLAVPLNMLAGMRKLKSVTAVKSVPDAAVSLESPPTAIVKSVLEVGAVVPEGKEAVTVTCVEDPSSTSDKADPPELRAKVTVLSLSVMGMEPGLTVMEVPPTVPVMSILRAESITVLSKPVRVRVAWVTGELLTEPIGMVTLPVRVVGLVVTPEGKAMVYATVRSVISEVPVAHVAVMIISTVEAPSDREVGVADRVMPVVGVTSCA